MFNNGKACTTESERTVPHCGPKPQLKDGVEHDCYIYTWNSAGTMEGIDIVMVRNTFIWEFRIKQLRMLKYADGGADKYWKNADKMLMLLFFCEIWMVIWYNQTDVL